MTDREAPKETPHEYPLPGWFLSCNVKTVAELSEVAGSPVDKGGEIDISKAEDGELREPTSAEGAINPSQDLRMAASCEKPGVGDFVGFGIPYKTFSEVRDTTAAALVFDREGEPLIPHGCFVLGCSTKNAVPLISELLLRVAKDLKAALVSVDLDDFEDLGWEFDDWDRRIIKPGGVAGPCREEPGRRDLIKGMAVHYFGARSKRNASEESWNRSMKTSAAILDSHIAKSRQQMMIEDISRVAASTINSHAMVADDTPLLVNVSNYNTIAAVYNGQRILKRLWNSVQDRRKSGRRVVLLISVFTCYKEVGTCGCRSNYSHDTYPGQKHLRKISSDIVPAINIAPSNLAELEGSNGSKLTGETNIRRLKRFLRYRIPHLLSPELARATGVGQPFSSWIAQGFKGKYESIVASEWVTENLGRAFRRIAGRAFGNSELSFSDVYDVLGQMGLCEPLYGASESEGNAEEPGQEADVVEIVSDIKTSTEESVANSTGESAEASTEERADGDAEKNTTSRTSEAWDEMLKRIERNANEQEKELIHCVIDPANLRTTFDDVVIDEETKETIRYLVSLSNFRVEAASESLFSHLRATGALFYGPPGTGKTHLSRAIAKASGSRMLSLDSATINSMWVGETEKYIKAAFTLSTSLFPCVLFIDEVDSLFYRRSSSDNGWERSALAQFLSEMDGLSKSDKAPFVVVATNRPQDLDEAFFRRLPHKIYFKLPEMESRVKILQIFLPKEDLDPLVDLKGLARCTDGYSGSDLRNLCVEAAMTWAIEQLKEDSKGKRANRLCLSVSHFAKALQKIRPSVSPQALDGFSEFARRFNPEATENSIPERMLEVDQEQVLPLVVLNARGGVDVLVGDELSQILSNDRRPDPRPLWVGSVADTLKNWSK